ncbi:hypothetical protein BBO99_00006238 [Phytophthora kernoviae]|uniref:EamA domain-containing protein n=2 Tax=Phytophthora kernoviae TaxID=325452 RepID=A0A3R7MUL2_9STRA|nr:hypothetical protein G195_007454 [Phytophthora kernoviae 00238/432]KAG2521991.1 hypothetical protein JM16_006040 [Phytophthora kernoviae]KAG2523603.1 hypothetical protein JM18_005707 [Phytophthora kernoviae]RLN38365.1 hypothetical protein BBI17_006342 [Phytophthora kernoviae]RLN78047.1 hypothetical protein BBO99_00006238 [Phytophthora kernoviae]
MSHRSGVMPASTKPLPTEDTKLLDGDDAELEKEVKEYFHTKYAGFLALLVVICTTICQAEAVQWLQTSVNFKKPFFTMCACHAAPVLLLPLVYAYYRICGGPEDRHAGFVTVLQNHSIIPISRLVRLAAFLGVFYLVADYFWFSSFKNLTVATGAAIFNSSPLFVYCFSICFLHEKISLKKLLGVLTAFGGVTLLVLFQDDADAGGVAGASMIGGLMMVIAAALNAGYNVSVALTAAEEMNDTSTLMIMMGISGVFTIPAWLIGTVVFAYSPFPSIYESVGFPTTAEGMLMLAIAVGMFTVNFVFLTFAVCWTSPLETSVGYMFTIPLSGLMDTVLHHASFSWECIIGSVLVMMGFATLELSSTHPPSLHSVDHEDHVKDQRV